MARILVIQHNLDDHLNELAAPLIEAGLEIDTWDVENAEAPTTPLHEYDGVISLGAIAGVLEEKEHAWMPVERKLFNQALDLEMPLLGICFGSQMLASAAGAEVYKTPTPEVGWTKVHMKPESSNDPIMKALGKDPDVFHFHYDTFNMPEGAKLYGTTNDINQAFKVGPKAWGVQFHIEVGVAAMHSWFATYPKAFEKLGISVEDQKALTKKNAKAYRERSIAVAQAFAKEVKKYHNVTK